jgi:hypothetical protein
LLFNYRTGKNISEKITMEKWGAKILDKIAEDLKAITGFKRIFSQQFEKDADFRRSIFPHSANWFDSVEPIEIRWIGK